MSFLQFWDDTCLLLYVPIYKDKRTLPIIYKFRKWYGLQNHSPYTSYLKHIILLMFVYNYYMFDICNRSQCTYIYLIFVFSEIVNIGLKPEWSLSFSFFLTATTQIICFKSMLYTSLLVLLPIHSPESKYNGFPPVRRMIVTNVRACAQRLIIRRKYW